MSDVFYYDAFQKTISPEPEGGPLVRHADYTTLEAEVSRLTALLDEAKKVVGPFSRIAGEVFRTDEDGREMNRSKKDHRNFWGFDGAMLTYGDLRAARAFAEKAGA